MLIKKISISNFQAHQKLNLDLAEFTAIIGPSSSGKSAIIRALSWMFYGDWDATYPNDAEKDTSIAIQLENGTIWGRFRKGKRNWAIVRKPGEKPLVYQDFGEIVPGLLEELNVRPIKVGTSKVNLNFSMQDDLPFMIHESKPAKAQWVGRLYGANIINMMMRLASKDKRSIESQRNECDELDVRLRAELERYSGLEDQSRALERVKELLDRLEALGACQASMAAIMVDCEALKQGRAILHADTNGLRIDVSRIDDLIHAQDERLSLSREEWALNQKAHLRDADTAGIRKDLEKLISSRERLQTHRQLSAEAAEAYAELTEKCDNGIGMRTKKLEELRKKLTESLLTDGRCPLCSSKPKKLDPDMVSTNLRELVGRGK